MIKKKVRLGDILIQNNHITQEQLESSLKRQKELNYSKKLGEIFIDEGYVTQEDILKTVSKQLNIDFVDLYGETIDFNAVATKYPLYILQEAEAIPFKEDDDFVYIATSDPLDYDALDALERLISFKSVKIQLAYTKDIQVIFHRIKILQITKEIVTEVKKELRTEGLKKEAEDSAIVKLILFIAKDAISKRASDIHIEPNEKEMIVRSRVDGMLHENFVFDIEIYHALSSRIKLLGNLDISEKRVPQDGRFSLVINEKDYDFRLSTTPTIFGESIVMRILDRDKVLLKLEDLGFEDENLDSFMDLIHAPNGIVLITGPTGSGKTTTLYSALNEIKNISNKVMTVEDPVEYRLPLVQQIQINEKTGLTFSTAIRSFLRQDPDVILIGEVRDFDTLNSASQAALTGHLVFSTLHTNDAPGAIPRMVQMGLKPYLIADALVGIVGQRLARKICPYCKYEIKPTKLQFDRIEKYLENKETLFYAGEGCSKCDFSGYYGRILISEILTIDTNLAKMVAEDANKIDIIEYAESHNLYKPMLFDGVKKVVNGKTTVEEVLRIVKDR